MAAAVKLNRSALKNIKPLVIGLFLISLAAFSGYVIGASSCAKTIPSSAMIRLNQTIFHYDDTINVTLSGFTPYGTAQVWLRMPDIGISMCFYTQGYPFTFVVLDGQGSASTDGILLGRNLSAYNGTAFVEASDNIGLYARVTFTIVLEGGTN